MNREILYVKDRMLQALDFNDIYILLKIEYALGNQKYNLDE